MTLSDPITDAGLSTSAAKARLREEEERDARLRLIRNPEPGDEYRNYICPKHGDVAGVIYTHVEVDKTETAETFCFRCIMDHFKDAEIARLGD